MITSYLEALSKSMRKRVQVPGTVETGYQTQKIQYAQGWKGGIKKKARASLHSPKSSKTRGSYLKCLETSHGRFLGACWPLVMEGSEEQGRKGKK
jgi:hypothetical protein